MRKDPATCLLVCAVLFLPLILRAELAEYTFGQAVDTYAEITGGTLLGSVTTDDQRFVDPAVPDGGFTDTGPGFPIGFSFNFNDNTFDVIGICANGWISLGQSSLGTHAVDMSTTGTNTPLSTTAAITPPQLTNRVTGFGRDIQARAGASLRVETIGTTPDRICVIQWKNYKRYGNPGTGDSLNFQIRLLETSDQVVLAYGAFAHGANSSPLHPQVGMRGPAAVDFANRTTTTDWAATTTGVANTATCDFSPTCIPPNGLMFEYTPPPADANDLQALSLTGPAGPSLGTPAEYVVTVRNRGTAAQSGYAVNLMCGEEVLASAAGPAIDPGQTLPVTITHTFTETGPITVFGRIDLDADQNPANNDTDYLDVVVQEAGTVLVEIGAGTQAQRQPYGVFYDYERDASLYTAAEIGACGFITALKWYCNTPVDLMVPYQISLKTVAESSLPAVSWAELTAGATPVSDGVYAFDTAGWVSFYFPIPFLYSGGNLLVLVETNIGDWQPASATFNYSTAAAGLHQYWAQDDVPPFGNGIPNASRPNLGIFLVTSGLGHLAGTVTCGTSPLEGAAVSVNGTHSTTTSADGGYGIQNLPEGPCTVTCSKPGYLTQALGVTIVENQTAILDFDLVASQTVDVTGTVVGSDNPAVGLAGATVTLHGILDYSATTDAQGQFIIQDVQGGASYAYTVTKAGYQQAAGTIDVGSGAYDLGTIVLIPTGNVLEESFEGADFPPAGWTQVITETGPANTYGVTPTWCRVGTFTPDASDPVVPPDGSWQVAMWWSYNHQDEWLISPEFNCPSAATLAFNGCIFLGSTHDDHYYVKASDDGGNTWDILWDSCAQTGGDYGDYNVPIEISLAAYAGQNIKLAWHADDPPSADGMWNIAAIDNIVVSGQVSNDEQVVPVTVTALKGNFPNPFHPETTITYSVKASTPVVVEIYNVKGQKVKTLVNENKAAGNHEVTWNGRDESGRSVTSGVYFYRMSAGSYSATRKMALLKH